MSHQITQSQTAEPLPFLMIDSADHLAGKTGLSPTVTLSKNGAAFAAPSGAVTEIGSGWYKVAGNATDSDTLGLLILHATSAGADTTDTTFSVVVFNPRAALATPTNITAGTITTVTNLTNAPTAGDLTATMKASVNTEADTALTDYDAPTFAELDARTDAIDVANAAIKAKTDSLTFTVAGQVDSNVQSINDVTITGNGQVGTEFGV